MKHYIYIKNDGLQLVSGKKGTFTYTTVPMQPGAIVNGVIMRPDDIKQAVAQLGVKKLKKVTLVVDSTNIIVKKALMPAISSSQLDQIIKGEFDLFQREDKYLFDSNVIAQANGTMTVLCYAVAKDFIEGYLSVFRELNIKVVRIDTAMNGIIKYVSTVEALAQQTFVLNIVSGENILSMLFENGVYKLSNRSRLMRDDNPTVYSQNLYTRLSSMVLFNQTEKSQVPIQHSYYIGLTDMELTHLGAYMVNVGSDIEPLSFPITGFDLSYLFPYAGQLKNKRDVNLAINKQEARAAARIRRGMIIRGLLLLLFCAALCVRGYMVYQEDVRLGYQIDTLNSYLQSSAVTTDLQYYDTLQEELNQLTTEQNQFNTLDNSIVDAKRLNATSMGDVLQGNLITGFTYYLSSNTIEISGAASTSAGAVAYAEGIRAADYFDNLRYTGYSKEESGVSPSGASILTTTYTFVAYADIPATESEVTNEAE